MFNEEQKLRFIKDTAKSASYQRNITLPLKIAEQFEKEWGDMSSWSEGQFEEFFKSRNYTSVSTMKSELGTVKRYCLWCLKNGIVSNCDAIQNIDTSGFVTADGAKTKMVDSPSALAEYLDSIFKHDAVENSAFKFYYWCAFMGFFEEDVLHINRDNVDLDAMVIWYNGEEYQIFDESIAVIKVLCDQNDGNIDLLQTFDTNLTPNSFSNKLSSKLNNGVRRFAFRNIRKSGIFYQTYQQELQGFPVRFDAEITKQFDRYEYSGWGDSTLKQKVESNRRGSLRNIMMQEYAAWKAAFNIDEDAREQRNLENARKHLLDAKRILQDILASKDAGTRSNLNTSLDYINAILAKI